jgi:hypothetical protein
MPRLGDEVRLAVEAVHEAQMENDPGSGRTRAASAEAVDLIRLPGVPYPEPEDSLR